MIKGTDVIRINEIEIWHIYIYQCLNILVTPAVVAAATATAADDDNSSNILITDFGLSMS
jgi:hypothetical protein